MISGPVVGWVVDVQRDFMDPPSAGGRLYVHDLFDPTDVGATQALPAIARTVEWLRAHAAALVYTGDWHAMGDREIDPVAPDATRGTYPPHCMGLSPDPVERLGAALVPSVAPDPTTVVVLGRDADADEARAAATAAAVARRPVFVQKREFSVFDGNAGADAFVRALVAEVAGASGDAPTFVVCGVAADVCVRQAVDGLLARGHRVVVVRDAMWGLGLEPLDRLLTEWQARGAGVTTSALLARQREPSAVAIARRDFGATLGRHAKWARTGKRVSPHPDQAHVEVGDEEVRAREHDRACRGTGSRRPRVMALGAIEHETDAGGVLRARCASPGVAEGERTAAREQDAVGVSLLCGDVAVRAAVLGEVRPRRDARPGRDGHAPGRGRFRRIALRPHRERDATGGGREGDGHGDDEGWGLTHPLKVVSDLVGDGEHPCARPREGTQRTTPRQSLKRLAGCRAAVWRSRYGATSEPSRPHATT